MSASRVDRLESDACSKCGKPLVPDRVGRTLFPGRPDDDPVYWHCLVCTYATSMPDEDLFDLVCVWHVRHADGTTEDIKLEHGNLVENNVGTTGQFLIYRTAEAYEAAQR